MIWTSKIKSKTVLDDTIPGNQVTQKGPMRRSRVKHLILFDLTARCCHFKAGEMQHKEILPTVIVTQLVNH